VRARVVVFDTALPGWRDLPDLGPDHGAEENVAVAEEAAAETEAAEMEESDLTIVPFQTEESDLTVVPFQSNTHGRTPPFCTNGYQSATNIWVWCVCVQWTQSIHPYRVRVVFLSFATRCTGWGWRK
jgi:hypothetical protein